MKTSEVLGAMGIMAAAVLVAGATQPNTESTTQAAVLAKQVSVNNAQRGSPTATWRVVGVLRPGANLVKVGDELTQPKKSEDWPLAVQVNELAILQLAKSSASATITKGVYFTVSDDPMQKLDAIIERETRGVADIEMLEKADTDVERAGKFAKMSRESKAPSLGLLLTVCEIAKGNEKNPEVQIALSDGLSFIATRQDVPGYVRDFALGHLEDATTIDEGKERLREIQIVLRLLEAFHEWKPELTDGVSYRLLLLEDIRMRSRWSWFRTEGAFAQPLRQFQTDVEALRLKLLADGDARSSQVGAYEDVILHRAAGNGQ